MSDSELTKLKKRMWFIEKSLLETQAQMSRVITLIEKLGAKLGDK